MNTMRILLVNTNTNRYLSPPPIGLAYLSAALKRQGHEVGVIDLMFADDPLGVLSTRIEREKPGLVGFSIRNLDNQSMLDLLSPLSFVRSLVAIARERNIPTVLGGTAFTSLPREMLEYMQADYGVAGDGEQGILALAEALSNNTVCAEAPGLVWRDAGEVRVNRSIVASQADAGHPDWGILDWGRHKKPSFPPGPGVLIKVGCPYHCSYCDSHTSMGRCFVLREPSAIVEDVRILRREHGITNFFLIDHCFNSPLAHAKAVLRELIRANLRVSLVASFSPIPGCYDDELFALFREAGGFFVVMDAESLSPAMLARYRKPFAVDDVYRCGHLARQHGVHFGAVMLFGGPGETERTIRETVDGLERLDFSLFQYNIGVRILPDTALYATAVAEGLVSSPSELLFPTFYLSKEMDLEWAKQYLAQAERKYQRRRWRLLPFFARNLLGLRTSGKAA
jgi:radical SAM superfamily enzyme YgiQ (UPF0313 family)